jgi:hypothetical protein
MIKIWFSLLFLLFFGCANQYSTHFNDLPIRNTDFTKNLKPYEGEPTLIRGTNPTNDHKMAENIGYSMFGYSSVDKLNHKKAFNHGVDLLIAMIIIYSDKVNDDGIYGYGASYWYNTYRKPALGAFCRESQNGLLITFIKPKTAAKRYFLYENDEILAINDKKMTKIDDFIVFLEQNRSKNVKISLKRGKNIIEKEIQLD